MTMDDFGLYASLAAFGVFGLGLIGARFRGNYLRKRRLPLTADDVVHRNVLCSILVAGVFGLYVHVAHHMKEAFGTLGVVLFGGGTVAVCMVIALVVDRRSSGA